MLTNVFDSPIGPLIGHRGVTETAPENTLVAIEKAAEYGCKWIEIDAQLTKDLIPVLMHDDDLDRTTSTTGRLADRNLKELALVDAGAWYDPPHPGEKIPTLIECLKLCFELDLRINVEIKPTESLDEITAEKVMETLLEFWPEDRDPPLISSFSRPAMKIAHAAAPHWPRGMLYHGLDEDWLEFAEEIEAWSLHVWDEDLTQEQVDDMHSKGYPVLVYSVDDLQTSQRMKDLGVDAIFTGAPEIMGGIWG